MRYVSFELIFTKFFFFLCLFSRCCYKWWWKKIKEWKLIGCENGEILLLCRVSRQERKYFFSWKVNSSIILHIVSRSNHLNHVTRTKFFLKIYLISFKIKIKTNKIGNLVKQNKKKNHVPSCEAIKNKMKVYL